MGIRNWRRVARNRKECRRVCGKLGREGAVVPEEEKKRNETRKV